MSENKEKEEERPIVAKSAIDLQRLKLQKLMKNPEKPIILPERPKVKNTPTVPEFVRNVMGSSAGAGSGEFHVYRHLRRKEYARQKFIQEKGRKELLDEEYHKKLEENKKIAEDITAKKRAKRQKKKQKWKQKKRMKVKDAVRKAENEGSSLGEESSGESYTNDKNESVSEIVINTKIDDNKIKGSEVTQHKSALSTTESLGENNSYQNELNVQEDSNKNNDSSEIVPIMNVQTVNPVNVVKNRDNDAESVCINEPDSIS